MPDISFLANLHPLAQFIIALGLAVAVVVAAPIIVRRAIKDATSAPPPVLQPVRSELHFEGPMEMLLREITRMAAALEKAPTDRADFVKWKEEFNEQFTEVRSKIYNEIDKRVREEARERAELEERIRDVELELARMGRGGRK
jgi:vacuolar-type H+-ATPase subunit I/STV1